MAKGRKTGGRKKGTPNRATVARQTLAEAGISYALSSGTTPLEVLLRVMRGGPEAEGITDLQFRAAMAAAPFIHPRLTASQVFGPTDGRMTHEDRLRLLEAGPELEGTAEEVPALTSGEGQDDAP